MFISEQHTLLQVKDQTKKRSFSSGTPLAKGHDVKKQFTYRELTLIIGIIVAVAIVILFTIMNRQSPELSSYTISQHGLLPSVTAKANSIVENIITEILF
jgi:hypothetical protein